MVRLLTLVGQLILVLLTLSSSAYLIEGCKSFIIEPRSWDYKGHHVGYEEVHRIYTDDEESQSQRTVDQEPVLLLNGFGVGSFHQHRLMPQILPPDYSNEKPRVVYGIDYLGQGRSWPIDCDDGNSENEKGLIYSADTWLEQIITFLEDVVLPQHPGKKIHVVGNSVGGYLSVALAAKRPDLVESICLLNATPVWGLNLPFWSGHLPPPRIPKSIGRFMFDKIRDLQTIEKYLENAYANREAFDEDLMQQIRSCTEGPGGHAAFASIMWSPPASDNQDFWKRLTKLECDCLLIFGKNDPWCKPAFAKRMLGFLSMRGDQNDDHDAPPVHRYLELENVGHCPNHEAPRAVGKLVRSWIQSNNRQKSNLSLIDGEEEIIQEPWADIVMREVDKDNIQVKLMDRIANAFI